MAQILTPGFLRWDGTKYILDPDVEGSIGPTIVNSGVGVLANIDSDENDVPASIIAFIGGSSMTVTGIKDGVESRELKIFNTDNDANLTIKHLDNTSSVNNRIICPGGVDYVLLYRESVLLIYSSVESKWRVVDRTIVIPTGSSEPGGLDTQLQFNDAGVLAGILNWNTSGENRVHVDYHIMTGGPSLDFNGNTITRTYLTWTGDGFKVGDIVSIRGAWFNNSNVAQTPLNIVNTVVTAVTATVLTITAVISPAGYGMAGAIFIQGGGLLTGGSSTALLPDSGIIRIPQTANYDPNTEIITAVSYNGNSVPLISISNGVELMIGGTFTESNLAAGVTNRRPAILAFWGVNHIDFTDERAWRDDKGSYTDYLTEFRARVSTTNATATQLVSKSVNSLQPYAFIELYVVASKNFPVDQGATWKFFGAKTSSGFDWQTATYHTNTAGASAWNCTVAGDATITVTGQAATNINWRVYGKFI